MRAISRSEEHVGEWKLTLWADTPEAIFVEAARVVSRECGPTRGDSGPWEHIAITARDRETLLVEWINELLGRSEINGRAYCDVEQLRIEDGRLSAEIRGRPVSSWRSALKAATYHGLQLSQEGKRWRAVVLVDV